MSDKGIALRRIRNYTELELLQASFPFTKDPLRVGSMFESYHGVSGGGESHPSALAEPDVSLATHPAPIVQPCP
jgi:hypothetical protein